MNGGISGSANLIATWLRPQDRHSTEISAMASGVERAGVRSCRQGPVRVRMTLRHGMSSEAKGHSQEYGLVRFSFEHVCECRIVFVLERRRAPG